MSLTKFVRRANDPTPEELLQLVIDAVATGEELTLRAVCERHAEKITVHMIRWRALPESVRDDPERTGQYVRCLVLTAQCMASLGHVECLGALTAPVDPEQ